MSIDTESDAGGEKTDVDRDESMTGNADDDVIDDLKSAAKESEVDEIREEKGNEPDNGHVSEADLLLFRGIARKNAGKNGFLSDWNQAKKLGSIKAAQLLESR